MARPRKTKSVCALPVTNVFVPDTLQAAEMITLSVEEYESIRLIDYQGMSQEECGRQMAISRTTVQQIYTDARRKLAEAIVEGCGIVIEGGDYLICDGNRACGRRCRQKEENTSCEHYKGGDHMLRIAVTYDNGQVFQHFGHTEQFKIYDTENGKIVKSEILESNGSGHGALATLLAINKVEVLICGGIGGGAQTALAQAGIRLYGGVQGNADAAVNMFIANKLSYDPNAKCDHHEHHGHHHGDHECGEHGCGEHSCGSKCR